MEKSSCMKKLIITFIWLISTNFAFAQQGYRFESDLEFKHDSSIVEGLLENYSLYTNEDVKLLIGFLEDKNFLDEIGKMSQSAIKEKFYSQASLYDPLNSQSRRSIIGFTITKNNLFTKVELEYTLLKKGIEWRESDVYVLGPKSTAFAALQFPVNISINEIKELKKGMHEFSLQDEKIVENENKVFNKINFEALTALSAKKMAKFLSLGSFFVSESFAAEASKDASCETSKYIKRGEFTTKKGSALFNFQKLANDIEVEAKKENPSQNELTCLSSFYKRARDDASTYWSERGANEGCLAEKGEMPSKKPDACSDSTFKEMKASFKYIDNVDKGLNDFLVGNVTQIASCDAGKPVVSEQMQVFTKMNSDIQQTFCCSNGDSTLDKGPLFTILESDDTFKKLSPTAQTEMCLLKTKTENKSFQSPTGMVDCLSSMVDGIANLAKTLIKTVVSVFDGELIKALGQFVANLPGSAVDMVKTIGEHIATQVYSVVNCMSPYEKNIYMCKMVPDVAAMLLGPGLVKNFLKALVDKTGKTALAQVIVTAAKGNKQFQQLQAAATKVAAGGRKVATGAMKIKAVRASAAALGKVASILGKDISTPFNKMVERKVKAAYANASLKAKTAAEKILRRKKPSVADEIADIDAEDVLNTTRASRDTITTLVEGPDGKFVPETPSAPKAASAAAESAAEASASSSETLRLTSSPAAPAPKLSANANEVVEKMAEYKKAVATGNPTEVASLKKEMQEAAKKLNDGERVAVSEAVAGKTLKQKGIIEAHEVGGPGRELGSYNQSELRLKARKAQRAGLNNSKRRELMEAGVLGGDSAGGISKAITLETPSGRISAKVLSSDGDSHLIEYFGPNGKMRFQKTFTTEQLESMGMKADVASVPAVKPAADLNSVFDDIEREGRERIAARAAEAKPVPAIEPTPAPATAVAEKVPERVPTQVVKTEPIKPATNILQERLERAQTPEYVNSYGVPKAELKTGNEIKVKVSSMDGVKNVEGEILNGIHLDSVSGMPSVQVKYADGVITEVGNVNRGKPNYKIESVTIDKIEGVKPKVMPKTEIIEAPVSKPVSHTVKEPTGRNLDPESYDGKIFRSEADSEALNALLNEHRVGGQAHIDNLNKQLRDDHLLRMKANSPNRDINKASKHGQFDSPNFDPKIYYADLAEEYSSAVTSASKFSKNGMPLESVEQNLKGRITYVDGNPVRVNSARDEIRNAMKKKGKTPEQIKEVEDWMDGYDQTIPRIRNMEKAKAAQAAFDKLKPKLDSIIRGDKQILAPSTFDDMAKNLKEMMLSSEKKEAAEAALRRIKCSRPEWKIGDEYHGFNLRCN